VQGLPEQGRGQVEATIGGLTDLQEIKAPAAPSTVGGPGQQQAQGLVRRVEGHEPEVGGPTATAAADQSLQGTDEGLTPHTVPMTIHRVMKKLAQ
jgi:hypothetical protein